MKTVPDLRANLWNSVVEEGGPVKEMEEERKTMVYNERLPFSHIPMKDKLVRHNIYNKNLVITNILKLKGKIHDINQ